MLYNAAPARAPDPALLAHTHHLIVNEHELAAFGDGEVDLEARARALLTRGPRAVTVTLGARGSLTVTADAAYRLPAHPVIPVDTTGAGDTFCGVLAAGLAQGQPLPDALHAAGVAAALACTCPGAQDAMPAQADIVAAR